jgi:hypothetical protein
MGPEGKRQALADAQACRRQGGNTIGIAQFRCLPLA